MVPLLLVDVKFVLSASHKTRYVNHLVFSLLLVIRWIWCSVGLLIRIVQHRGSILWEAVFKTNTIESQTSNLHSKSPCVTKVLNFVDLLEPMLFHNELFTLVELSLVTFNISRGKLRNKERSENRGYRWL